MGHTDLFHDLCSALDALGTRLTLGTNSPLYPENGGVTWILGNQDPTANTLLLTGGVHAPEAWPTMKTLLNWTKDPESPLHNIPAGMRVVIVPLVNATGGFREAGPIRNVSVFNSAGIRTGSADLNRTCCTPGQAADLIEWLKIHNATWKEIRHLVVPEDPTIEAIATANQKLMEWTTQRCPPGMPPSMFLLRAIIAGRDSHPEDGMFCLTTNTNEVVWERDFLLPDLRKLVEQSSRLVSLCIHSGLPGMLVAVGSTAQQQKTWGTLQLELPQPGPPKLVNMFNFNAMQIGNDAPAGTSFAGALCQGLPTVNAAFGLEFPMAEGTVPMAWPLATDASEVQKLLYAGSCEVTNMRFKATAHRWLMKYQTNPPAAAEGPMGYALGMADLADSTRAILAMAEANSFRYFAWPDNTAHQKAFTGTVEQAVRWAMETLS